MIIPLNPSFVITLQYETKTHFGGHQEQLLPMLFFMGLLRAIQVYVELADEFISLILIRYIAL
jgi:hypothetical protein